ncbi:MAG: hypothetical protein BGO37_15155 [Cellulomonas sp. 73-92]|uniref:DUF4190 domain-containing protein n=1 Tax=Cellulomonas sp. 73-92 TaxID=1895740 RepID=UPI0009280577|nr:DUF4190 domain-containing protein [Cellulomonas sp. 73-92]OJV80869.1 MAG: hypothetical protein BGO37_15155 [Cellulomonas sp. 73-92]
MDEQPAWTPGEVPEPVTPAGPPWNQPPAPGAGASHADPGSSYAAPPGDGGSADPGHAGLPQPAYPGAPRQGYPGQPAGYPASSYPPPAAASPYGAPVPSAAYGGPAPFGQAPYGTTSPTGYPPVAPGFGGAPSAYPGPIITGPGYPPPGQPYGSSPYATYAPYNPSTDGFAIAALVFGILGGWLSLVFGPIALSRIKKSGARGRGMALAGIWLGAAWIVGGILLAIAIPVFLNQRHQALHDECANGNMSACDTLYNTTRDGSAEHAFGDTCGGRTQGGYECTSIGAVSYGDNTHLDRLWDACAAGDGASCDELYTSAPPGSDYAEYGMTCGGRTDGSAECVVLLGQNSST